MNAFLGRGKASFRPPCPLKLITSLCVTNCCCWKKHTKRRLLWERTKPQILEVGWRRHHGGQGAREMNWNDDENHIPNTNPAWDENEWVENVCGKKGFYWVHCSIWSSYFPVTEKGAMEWRLILVEVQGVKRETKHNINYLRHERWTEVMFSSSSLSVSVCLLICLWGYLKLWTDSGEIWWTGWVCEKDEFVRICWRSDSWYDNFFEWFVTMRDAAKNYM